MFQRGDHAALVLERRVALKAAHRRDAELGVEERIFAVRFLHAPPARVARHVHHRRERLMRAANARLVGGHRVKLLDEFGIERRAQTDGLRKARAVLGRVAVETFLVENHGDAEPRFLDEKFLDGVGEFRHAARGLAIGGHGRVASRIAGATDLAHAVAFLERRLRFGGIEVAAGVHEFRGLLLPEAHHLRGFFFEGHPREQIFDAGGGGQGGVFVSGRFRHGTAGWGWQLLHARFNWRR